MANQGLNSNQKPQQNSQETKKFNTKPISGKGESRNEKRRRWAKKNKPQQKSLAPRKGPEKEYLCACHSEPARKPVTGMKEVSKDFDSGKMKENSKGLGKWRCTTSGKITKVTPRKPAPKEMGIISTGISPYPGKLTTPEVTVATA
jgi:hypothetical protein